MKKIITKLVLSCLKATELIEKSKLISLKRTEKLQLKIHLKICAVCMNYKKDSAFLDDAIKKQYTLLQNHQTLTDIKKTAIIQQLKQLS